MAVLKSRGAAAVAALLLLNACSSRTTGSTEGPPASEAAIEAHLQARLKALAVAYPEARLSDLRFSPDRKVVCGRLTSSEEEPLIFASHDTTPATVEDRPLGIPVLTEPGAWTDEKTVRGQERIARQCRLAGLLSAPDDPPASRSKD